ncbi:MAG: AAA family ATPase, partial [Candidatus Micrarchaeota archaeon]
MPVRGADDGRRKKGVGARSLRGERVKSLLKDMEHDPSLANALLVMLGALFLLTSFNFYPWWILPIIIAGLGIIAYKFAPLGTLLGVLLAFPAIAYQSPVLAWVYMLFMAITMFYTFSSWHIISALMILILAPFTSVPFLAGIVIPLLMLSALLLGSRHSIQLTLPCVFIVLLLSAVWHTDACREGLSACSAPGEYAQDNGAFMPIKKDVGLFEMRPGFAHLQRSDKPAPQGFSQMLEATANSLGSLLSGETIRYMNDALGAVFNAIVRLLFYDSALIQIIFWGAAVFLVPFISGRVRHPKRNLIASFSFVLIPVGYFIACMVSEAPFNPAVFAYVALSVFIAGLLEYANINLSREISVSKAEKTAQFGKFGLQDLSTSAGAESLSDVGGYESTKQELMEAIVWPIRRRDLSNVYGIKPPKGILLFGPPGTGKTMLMRALARELEIGFYYVKCSDLLSEWYGESEKNITELFKVARKASPCVLFFDEIDSIGKSRDAYTADDVAPRVLSLLLSEIDGFKTEKNVIMIGATNIPNQLDHALLRPGRFDKIIYMPLPDKRARLEIFLVHTKNLPLDDDVDFNKLADMTERYSGADIQNICMEAARKTARDAAMVDMRVPVTMSHFIDCIDDIKPSVSLAKLEEYEQFRLDYERRAVGTEVREEKVGKVGWDDVAGLESVKKALIEAIEIPLLHEDLIKQYKVKPSKGVLLFGPPGCGKTLIVRAAANELKVTFITL